MSFNLNNVISSIQATAKKEELPNVSGLNQTEARQLYLWAKNINNQVYENRESSAVPNELRAKQYADSLFYSGHFFDASKTHPDAFTRQRYAEYDVAVKQLNTVCNCPNIVHSNGYDAKGYTLPSRRKSDAIWSEVLNKEIVFWRCDTCQTLSATDV